jgi:hypothetical protein
MEHQMESYPFVKSTIQLSLQLIRDLLDEERPQLTSTLNTMISTNGLKLENLKGMSIDSRLIYINAQLLVISLCESLNKEIQKLGIDGVNLLESEKQLESRIFCLKETLIKTIHRHTNRMD